MISYNELLSGHVLSDVPIEYQHNLEDLKTRINVVREKRGIPMIVTSGFRSMQDHLRIYRSMGVPDDKIPMNSWHLKGAAVDISDPDGSLMQWCRDNVPLLEEVGLWIEDDTSVKRVHFQIFPPKSGNRFFKP